MELLAGTDEIAFRLTGYSKPDSHAIDISRSRRNV